MAETKKDALALTVIGEIDRSGISRYAPHGTLGKRIATARADPDLLQLLEEVALFQAIVSEYLEGNKNAPVEGEFMIVLVRLLSELGRLKESAFRVSEAWSDKRAMAFMTHITNAVREILQRNLVGAERAIPRILFELADAAEKFKV